MELRNLGDPQGRRYFVYAETNANPFSAWRPVLNLSIPFPHKPRTSGYIHKHYLGSKCRHAAIVVKFLSWTLLKKSRWLATLLSGTPSPACQLSRFWDVVKVETSKYLPICTLHGLHVRKLPDERVLRSCGKEGSLITDCRSGINKHRRSPSGPLSRYRKYVFETLVMRLDVFTK
jgi:hypothetical protein